MNREALLQGHVMAVEGLAVEWGVSDCTSWCAAWVALLTGKVVPRLGEYSSIEEAHRLVEAAGGLDVLWMEALAQTGFHPAPHAPSLGDIGIVNTLRFGAVGVIFAADGIALWRAKAGTAMLRPRRHDIVKVWALIE